MIFHSPTERGAIVSELIALGNEAGITVRSSGKPEPMGVDFLWLGQDGAWRGVQRKELTDYVASLQDARLTKELGQMASHITMPLIVLEGKPTYSGDDITMGSGRWSKTAKYSSYVRQQLSIMDRGVQVLHSTGARQTAQMILAYYQWSQAESHSTAMGRPGPAGDWGKPTNRDWQIHLLQGIDGIGAKTAADIIDTIGNPLVVRASIEELMSVPGIGKKTAMKIIASVNGEL